MTVKHLALYFHYSCAGVLHNTHKTENLYKDNQLQRYKISQEVHVNHIKCNSI